VQESFDEVYGIPADDDFWQVPTADRGGENLFADATYDRGAMTLHVLRTTIGDRAFFTVLKKWAARDPQQPATTAQFRALAEQVSGKRLGTLFDEWLYQPGKPAGLAEGAASPGTSPRR
jgi:aminopeptidase N